MTTPGQLAPDGSYVIGGGDWGQNVDESLVLNMVRPLPNPVDAIGQFREYLSRIPLDALQVFEPFLEGVEGLFNNVGSAVQAIIDALLGSPMWLSLTAFAEWLSQAFDPIKDLVNSAHDYIQQLFGLVGDIVTNFIEGWGEFLDDLNIFGVFNTSQAIQAAITSLTSQINELLANGGHSENFINYPNGSLGPKWSSWHNGDGSGVVKIDKGRMLLPDPPFLVGTRRGFTRYVAHPTNGDYQRIGVAFGSRPATSLIGFSASNCIFGRMNTADSAAASSYVYVRMENRGCEIGYRLNGVDTVIKSFPTFQFNLSSAYWLECGVRGDGTLARPDAPYTFRLWENNIPIHEAVDGTNKAPFGAANRYCGVGFVNPALQSASVASFAIYDK